MSPPLEPYEYSFQYPGPFQYTEEEVDSIEVYFPEINDITLNNILRNEGTYVDALTITLLWNADDDLDLAFICDDGETIDWGNKEGNNACGAIYDVE